MKDFRKLGGEVFFLFGRLGARFSQLETQQENIDNMQHMTYALM